MALYNILRKTDVVLNGQGNPVGGGEVFLYEPGGTSTQITSYKDSGLQDAHTQPIGLSGSGRANIWITRDCDMYVYDRNGNLVVQELNANPAQLDAGESGGLINNGSFEVDDDDDGEPDFWDRVDEPGSNNGIDDSESTDGSQSFQFVSTGDGGGTLTTSDFFPVNDSDNLRVEFDLLASVADVRNIVRVQWFDVSQVAISNSDIYDSTANPTNWSSFSLSAEPPADARFAKLAIVGCEEDGSSGSTNVDRVSVFYPPSVSGTFDNITLQDNEIITINTNGPLAITPNGDGSVDIGNTNDPDLSGTTNAANIGTSDPDSNPHLAMGPSIIQGKADDTSTARLDLQPLGGAVRLGAQSGTGDVALYNDADRVARTASEGVDLFGTSSGEPDGPNDATTLLRLFNADASNPHGTLGFHGAANLTLTNQVYGGQVVLRGVDDDGDTQVLLEADPEGQGVTVTQLNGGNLRLDGNTLSSTDEDGDIVLSPDGDGVAQVPDYDGTDRRVGYVPAGVALSSSRSMVAADIGHILPATAAVTYTVETGIGDDESIVQIVTDEAITIAEGTGVTLTLKDGISGATGDFDVAADSVVTLVRRASGAWDLFGNGITGA